jgi:mRNA deadenylase 3'-5' endonuclease subunit Ccr4
MSTWNTLATAYIRPEYYPRTPKDILDPAWRIPALVTHARVLDAEILCLQEVETVLFNALQKALKGYVGIHSLKGGQKPDGCATFFREPFTLVNHRRVEYRDHSGHLAQCLVLGDKGRRLAVVNTHLKWDRAGTAREKQWGYGQIFQAMETLEEDQSDGQVVCGDFNATPESDVVMALMAAGFSHAHQELPGISTCNSNGSAKLIDYLFSRGSLKSDAIAPVPIYGTTPLPSEDQPSDHLPLVARFEWV